MIVMDSELREKIEFIMATSENVDDIMQLITQSNLDLLKRLEAQVTWADNELAVISHSFFDRERERIERGEG